MLNKKEEMMEEKQLRQELFLRREKREIIRKRVDDFCREHYGLESFFALLEEYFPAEILSEFHVCLARQIPTPNVEHLALYLAASQWNIKPLFVSHVRDAYPQSGDNDYKKSLISSPLIFRGRKGNLVVKCERISEGDIQGAVLGEIGTKCHRLLPEVHREMMDRAIPPGGVKCFELGGLFQRILLSCRKNLPSRVFLKNGQKERVVSSAFCREKDDPRPPAEWCYFFHLLLFLDGRMALASTVDEDPRVIAWFKENTARIKEICGFAPLILDTPLKVNVEGFCSKLNEIPRKALGGNGFLPGVKKTLPERSEDFYHLMKHFEEKLIVFA